MARAGEVTSVPVLGMTLQRLWGRMWAQRCAQFLAPAQREAAAAPTLYKRLLCSLAATRWHQGASFSAGSGAEHARRGPRFWVRRAVGGLPTTASPPQRRFTRFLPVKST